MMMETEESMAKALEWMLHEFSAIRTGKASPALVENIEVHVPSYGSNMRLKELALITTPEPRLLMVQPFDADNSYLVQKIEGTGVGSRMPIGQALSAPQEQLVRDWVN